jgi:hypothetical protein
MTRMQSGRRRRLLHLCAAVALTAGAAARADIVIEGSAAGGGTSRVVIGTDKARIDTADANVHTLIDLTTRRTLAVYMRDGFAMDLGSPRQQRSEHARMAATGVAVPEVRLEDTGAGPEIAGYATRRYRVMVNDVHCGDEFLASAPLAEPAIRSFVEIMAAVSDDQDNRVLTLLTEPDRLCEVTDDLVDDQYPRLGIPLRNLDRDGRTTHEITRIRLDAPAQPALFELPADFPVLTRAQVLERMGDSDLDAAAVAEKQRRIQERMEEIEDQRRETAVPAGPESDTR